MPVLRRAHMKLTRNSRIFLSLFVTMPQRANLK
nr:MAG TPA: hypothetical protein [Caudoviricetes sp.]